MSTPLAVDFGTSNTVVAAWRESRGEGMSLYLPEIGRMYLQGNERISVVPSLIHYGRDGRRLVGQEVLGHNVYGSHHTFRWMKHYVARRSPASVCWGDQRITHADAGRAFLERVLAAALRQVTGERQPASFPKEVAFTAPVEAFEHYESWLLDLGEGAGLSRVRLLDEPSAAALGYGLALHAGDVYLVFDFGGGTLDVSLVLVEPEGDGPRCRVLGKAGTDLGGVTLDQWLYAEVLRRNDLSDADDEVRRLSRVLLIECERAKERLSLNPRAVAGVVDPRSGAAISASFTRDDLEALLDEHEAYTRIHRTVDRALNAAHGRGYVEGDIRAVLMVGGSSQIPSVQRELARRFGRDRVMRGRPLDAVACGAAAFAAGAAMSDHIQHDYCLRHVDRQRGGYAYRTIVPHGTPYPSDGPIHTLTLKASYDGQEALMVAVFEIGDRAAIGGARGGETDALTRDAGDAAPTLEIVFDAAGAARFSAVAASEAERRHRFWMNEGAPTLLALDPPGVAGVPRCQVELAIDANKRLLITARDLQSGRLIYERFPVANLR